MGGVGWGGGLTLLSFMWYNLDLSKLVFVAVPCCLIEVVADPFVGGLEFYISCGLVHSG